MDDRTKKFTVGVTLLVTELSSRCEQGLTDVIALNSLRALQKLLATFEPRDLVDACAQYLTCLEDLHYPKNTLCVKDTAASLAEILGTLEEMKSAFDDFKSEHCSVIRVRAIIGTSLDRFYFKHKELTKFQES